MKIYIIFLLAVIFHINDAFSAQEQNKENKNPRFEKTWPNSEDLKWFHKAKGMTEKEVLIHYGQPSKKTKTKDGIDRWFYPWAAAAFMDFKDGKIEFVFYTAGY